MKSAPNNSVLIICLKYAPGNWQHMKSFAHRLLEKGINAHLILSKKFCWMNREFADITTYSSYSYSLASIIMDVALFCLYKWFFYFTMLKKNKPSTILFVMWHPLNQMIAMMVKIVSPDTRLVCWMHEPYKVDKSVYKGIEIIFYGIEFLQEMLVPYLDTVVVHSNRALKAFRLKYPRYKKDLKMIPLLFRDEIPQTVEHTRPIDVTFIGVAAKAKGIDLFFNIVEKSRSLGLDLKFKIVTSTDVSEYLGNLGKGWEDCLEVISKNRLSDEDIREACSRSFAIIAPYRETTQSGVIPVAFMCGTPVLGTSIEGLREYIRDDVNGVLVPIGFSFEDAILSINYLKNNFNRLSIHARKSFEITWDDRNWDKYYGWLMDYDSKAETEIPVSRYFF